ncbi:hypothetical protein DPMN_090941 [Dreissena polymorpha]|uniref:Uncharacterized protein n=1 Tax=Dreissena polymorpha TaxID=45954 RepID=A0A9D4QZH3_DREPO|nr:hypothetical protein DPMN_090941 [Dreissena polymorpha]
MGGFYERLVGLVKRSLRKSVGRNLLTEIQMQTLVKEVESVVNSRPSNESVKELIINAETEHVERHHTPEESHQVTIAVEEEEVTQHRIPLTESCLYSDISDDEIDFGNWMDSVIVGDSPGPHVVGMSSTSSKASLGEEQGISGSPSPSSSLHADDEIDFGNWFDSVIVGEPPVPHVVGMSSTSSTASLGEVQCISASPSPSSSWHADVGLLFYEPTLYEVYHTSCGPRLDLVPFNMIEPEEATGDNDIPQFSGNEETVVELINPPEPLKPSEPPEPSELLYKGLTEYGLGQVKNQ